MTTEVASECWAMIYRLVFEGEVRNRMASACSAAGVPPGVVKMLIHLDPDEPMPMRDLAAHFGVDASYITTMVDELEEAGLAERQPYPTDRRVKTIALTAEGRAIQQQVHELIWAPPQWLEALSVTQQRHLHDLLAKMTAADQRVPVGHSSTA